MILVDTGPFVALFDPKDGQHVRCRKILKGLRDPLFTTIPVLTEAFHMLSPGSYGASRLRDFLLEDGASIWFMDLLAMRRAFSLMDRYADHPMDLADASLITAAEILGVRQVFTLDRADFSTYRVQRGHALEALEVLS